MPKLINNWDGLRNLKAGDALRILKTATEYLPVGFEAEIKEIGQEYVVLYDEDRLRNNESYYTINSDELLQGDYTFELVTAANPLIKTTVTKRKAAAKSIREAEEALMSVINKGKSVGLSVSVLPKLVITHQPDTETY